MPPGLAFDLLHGTSAKNSVDTLLYPLYIITNGDTTEIIWDNPILLDRFVVGDEACSERFRGTLPSEVLLKKDINIRVMIRGSHSVSAHFWKRPQSLRPSWKGSQGLCPFLEEPTGALPLLEGCAGPLPTLGSAHASLSQYRMCRHNRTCRVTEYLFCPCRMERQCRHGHSIPYIGGVLFGC